MKNRAFCLDRMRQKSPNLGQLYLEYPLHLLLSLFEVSARFSGPQVNDT
jgi:hypothetical protein